MKNENFRLRGKNRSNLLNIARKLLVVQKMFIDPRRTFSVVQPKPASNIFRNWDVFGETWDFVPSKTESKRRKAILRLSIFILVAHLRQVSAVPYRPLQPRCPCDGWARSTSALSSGYDYPSALDPRRHVPTESASIVLFAPQEMAVRTANAVPCKGEVVSLSYSQIVFSRSNFQDIAF